MPVCDGTQNVKRYQYFFSVTNISDTGTFLVPNFSDTKFYQQMKNSRYWYQKYLEPEKSIGIV